MALVEVLGKLLCNMNACVNVVDRRMLIMTDNIDNISLAMNFDSGILVLREYVRRST